MRRLNVLFYGMTHEHAPGKLESLKRLRDVFNVVAIVDDRPRLAPQHNNERLLCEGIGIVSEKEAWQVPDVDVVFVETANRDLMEIAAEAARRGLPMHCDKPCGEGMEPYRSIVEVCRVKNVPFQIGYMYRGNPAVKFIWDFVAKGGLGDVTFVEADMNHDYQLAEYPAYLSTFRGGILYNLGCHLVDMVLPMMRGRFLSASPFVGDAPGDSVSSRTRGSSILRFEGSEALIRCSSHMPGGHVCRRLRIDGTNGTIDLCPIERFDGGELKLSMILKNPFGGRPAGAQEITFGIQTDRYASQLLELAAVVRGETPNNQDYDRDLLTHEMTLRACGYDKVKGWQR